MTQLIEKFNGLSNAFNEKLRKVEEAKNMIDSVLQEAQKDFNVQKSNIVDKLSESSLEIRHTSQWGIWPVILIGEVFFLYFFIYNFYSWYLLE
jgi:hypothetical protein